MSTLSAMVERSERVPVPSRGNPVRHAYCPLCGHEQVDRLARDVIRAEDALCPGPCAAAWQTLKALRGQESVNESLATRRRAEHEAGRSHAPVLSELLLQLWQA